jgi:hypothetical protein
MALEAGNYVGDLVAANPAAADPKSQGDDHLRLIKLALRQTFPGFAGAVIVGGTNGGAANAYTLTPTQALLAYTAGSVVEFTPAADNTGASTLNISGLGLRDVKSVAGAVLLPGELAAGRVYLAAYNGTEFRLLGPTKQYVDQLAFSTALPLQSGATEGFHIVSRGGVAAWEDLFGKFVALATVL